MMSQVLVSPSMQFQKEPFCLRKGFPNYLTLLHYNNSLPYLGVKKEQTFKGEITLTTHLVLLRKLGLLMGIITSIF